MLKPCSNAQLSSARAQAQVHKLGKGDVCAAAESNDEVPTHTAERTSSDMQYAYGETRKSLANKAARTEDERGENEAQRLASGICTY